MSSRAEDLKQIDRDRGYARYHNDPIYRMKTQLRAVRRHCVQQLAADKKEMHVRPWCWKAGLKKP